MLYSRGAQIPAARPPCWLNFALWHWVLLDSQYVSGFISASWRLEFGGGPYISGEVVHACHTVSIHCLFSDALSSLYCVYACVYARARVRGFQKWWKIWKGCQIMHSCTNVKWHRGVWLEGGCELNHERTFFSVHGSVHRKYILIYIQQDATLHSLFISGNCSTCFGWYLHPSSGAHTTVSTASGTCQNVTAIVEELESSNSSTIAADSSNGLTSTRCSGYSCMCCWWWVEIPPETFRAVSRNKYTV
jgi:hypothetical protein